MEQNSYYTAVTEPASPSLVDTSKRLGTTGQENTMGQVYQQARDFFSSLDKSISKCKKYNEDRTYRKYQNYIKDLQKDNKELRYQIQILEQTASPTKHYMMDLLDKLVQCKRQKEELAREILELKATLALKQVEIQQYNTDINKFQKVIRSTKIEKLPPIQDKFCNLEDTLRAYLKEKEKLRLKFSFPPSFLELFVNSVRSKLWNWSLTTFLEELQDYIQNSVRPKQSVDLWRAQFRASKNHSNLSCSSRHKATSTKNSMMTMSRGVMKKSMFRSPTQEV